MAPRCGGVAKSKSSFTSQNTVSLCRLVQDSGPTASVNRLPTLCTRRSCPPLGNMTFIPPTSGGNMTSTSKNSYLRCGGKFTLVRLPFEFRKS